MKLSLRQFPLTLTPSLSHLPNPFFSPPPFPLPLKRLSFSLSISLTPSHFLPLIQVPSIPLPLILFLHSFPLPFIFSFSSKTLLSSPFISHFGALLSYFFFFFIHNSCVISLCSWVENHNGILLLLCFIVLFWKTPQQKYNFIVILSPEYNGILVPLCPGLKITTES